MPYQADYFMTILNPYRCASHFKSNCFCELFSEKKNTRKLIADAFLTKSTVIDRLHDNVRGDTPCRLAMSDHKRSIAHNHDVVSIALHQHQSWNIRTWKLRWIFIPKCHLKNNRMLWMSCQRESISSRAKDGKKKFSFQM